MARTRLRLHHRIAVPFVLIGLVAISTVALVARSLISRTLESRVEAQIRSASAVIGQSGFALNPSILRSVKDITGADVITFDGSGAVLASTVDPARRPDLISTVTRSEAARLAQSAGEQTPVVRRMDCGVPCYVAYRPVGMRAGTVVALVAETSEVLAVAGAITRTLLLVAGLSLIVMTLASQVVARRVTAPLDALVQFTRDVLPVSSRRRAPAGDDEVGRLAAAFNEMLDRLESSQQALVRSEKLAVAGLLAARVAHDIRNPLSSIKMRTQLLRARCRGDEEGQTIVSAVLRDVEQVESVIRDLLETARPGDLRLQTIELNAVVRDVVQQLLPQLTHRKIAVGPDLDASLPPVRLDTDRFKQALLNVIVNAADAMPTGGTLEIRTLLVDGGSAITLNVCDDGIGVDPAMLEKVFDPFVSSKRDGVGLGLVNAKAVVESHGGSIALSARRPKGTQVTIRLPVHEASHA